MAKIKQYFLGMFRSKGSMPSEDGKTMITWDNVVIHRMQDQNPDDRPECIGREKLESCKIKFDDFEEVTGESYEEFKKKAPSRLNQPIIVHYGEMRGTKDNRKADTVLLRFVGPDGKITI